jgi:cystathionine beta-synthase
MNSVLELIGNTPIVKISRIDTGPCELYLKLESQNPGGSIKDRVALYMIAGAEQSGRLKPGGTLVEATAGNTGIGLALVAKLKGYRIILVIPDKMSREKVRHLKALGAEIVVTRSDVNKGHPEYYQDLAKRIASETPGAIYVDQFNNPDNSRAHEESTGPELWEQMGHDLDAIVVGVGSGGTLGGLTKYFARTAPGLQFVLADPLGSILAHYVETGEVRTDAGSWYVEGIGEDFLPSIADFSRCKKAYTIPDAESLGTARLLLEREGILGGSSTGTLLASALRFCREQTSPKRVLTFVCDTGNKYLSKMYDDQWMRDHGLTTGTTFGDLRDLIPHRYGQGGLLTITPEDTVLRAFNLMGTYEVSQLPVLDNDKVVGIVDESDILVATRTSKAQSLSAPVRSIMTSRLETVTSKQTIDELLPLFDRGLVPLVFHEGAFAGLITRMDVISYLRRTESAKR